jgi:hypothetical protein
MDIFRGIYGFFNRSDDLDFNSKRQGSSVELNRDNECIDGSSNHASSAPLSVEEVDDFEKLPLESISEVIPFVSVSVDNTPTVNLQCARVAPFVGIGKMKRPNWVPKSLNNIKKMKYYGINDFGYHLFKVWYVGLLEFEWEYRDFEELIETFPHLRELCIEEIRKSGNVDNVSVAIQGAHYCSSIAHAQSSQARYEDIPFQASTKFCAQYSFLNVMGMGHSECEHLHQAIPGDFTNLSDMARFLATEKFVLIKKKTHTDKVKWITTEAPAGKYLVSGNGHVVGIDISDITEALIYDPAELKTKRLNKRNLEYSIGKNVDDIRLILDHRSKRSKQFNCFSNQAQ